MIWSNELAQKENIIIDINISHYNFENLQHASLIKMKKNKLLLYDYRWRQLTKLLR